MTQHTPGPWKAEPIIMSEADARLYAAAPDLLAALVEIDKIGNGIKDTAIGAYASLLKCGQIARAAIAKAEGAS